MKRPWIQCDSCMGRGQGPMPNGLFDALCTLKRGRTLTAESIHAIIGKGIGLHAINNRLVKLETLGFVTRTKKGKTYLWKLK